MQQTTYFRNHKTAGAVVNGTTDKFVFVEDMEAVRISDDTSHMYVHFFNFFFVFGAYVYKDIIQFRHFFFTTFSRMNGRPSKDTIYDSLFGVNIHPFGGCDLVVTTAVADHINQPLVCNVINIP